MFVNTTGSQNVAVGSQALNKNSTGTGSTAVGYFAMFNTNGIGSSTAVGFQALMANTTGFNNAAFGVRPLASNVDGSNNTAIGNLALTNNVSTSNHVAVGRLAGSGITTANNNIIVGHHSGVHSVFGQASDRCFIDNIHGAPVSAGTAAFVLVDSDGRWARSPPMDPTLVDFRPKASGPKPFPTPPSKPCLISKFRPCEQSSCGSSNK